MNKNLALANSFYTPLNLIDMMDRMFEDAFTDSWFSSRFTSMSDTNGLKLDIHENDAEYNIDVSLAGVSPEAIDVKLNGDILTISGEMQAPEVNDDRRVVVQERYYGKFSRNIRLPQNVDVNKVEANYDNGILSLAIPKLPDTKPKQIEVKVKSNKIDDGIKNEV